MLTEGIWETHRPVAMMMSSTSGGIIEKPFAPTEQELWEIIDRQLRIERSEGGVGRSNGRHRRRFRPDLGTTEDTSHDTAGGNFFLIIALRRLHREKTGKIMYHKKMGDFEQKIRAQYPELFGTEFPTPQTFDRVHANRMATAKNSQSLVQPLDGSHPVPATFLLNRVYEFVQAPDSYYTQAKHIGLPPGLHYVLRNASKPPTDYKNGLSTFYKIGGTGNLSQYMIHHCQQLMENQHMSEKDAIIQTTLDVAQAFHNHIKSLDPHEVAYLYKY
jgi:hypothetical protein